MPFSQWYAIRTFNPGSVIRRLALACGRFLWPRRRRQSNGSGSGSAWRAASSASLRRNPSPGPSLALLLRMPISLLKRCYHLPQRLALVNRVAVAVMIRPTRQRHRRKWIATLRGRNALQAPSDVGGGVQRGSGIVHDSTPKTQNNVSKAVAATAPIMHPSAPAATTRVIIPPSPAHDQSRQGVQRSVR